MKKIFFKSAFSAISTAFSKTFLYTYIGFPKNSYLKALKALIKKPTDKTNTQPATLTLVGLNRRNAL